MKNKLQRWVDGLMEAKAARVTPPRQVIRGINPEVWKDITADMRSGKIQRATNVQVVDGV